MTIINRFGIAFLLIAAALPYYASAQISARGESSCKSADFWFEEKKCCLPLGGPHSHHEPPAEKQCPHEWSWSEKHGHCIPHYPHPEHQCSKDWDWSPASFCCERSPHHPQPPHPKPSGVHHDGWKRGESEHNGKSKCKEEEFWFSEKECCLPIGGPHWHHEPPAHKQCPPDWSWSKKHNHCVPRNPSHPPPQCSKDWDWSPASFCCEKSPHHPKPSSGVNNHHNNNEWKRSPSHMSRALQLCPKGLKACPIAAPSGLTGDYECLDTAHELESCGGCASTGEGQDCTAIRGVWNVGCVQGRCAVYTCAAGYKRSSDGKSCVQL